MPSGQKYMVIKDRVEVYKDFTLNLLYYIIHYYLDRKTLSNDEDIRNHFHWCFNKVCNEFKEEDIDFSDNKVLEEYFYQFYYYQFYKLNFEESTHDNSLSFYEKFWRNIFEYNKQKNKNVVNTLIEIYYIFDTSISIKKNILEKI
jgi:hypothetical protein